jgi:tetratricopeptide (TPR) repeat protein
MISLAKKYPDDAEVQTLSADAIMNTMPWDYWLKDGSPKPETQRAKGILETALKKFPRHPGAHHLYIHLVEASPNPEMGLTSAAFLENAMPGAGHIVHMPAHIYLRLGQFSKSIESNKRAVMVDEEYLSNSSNRSMYRWAYYPHNVDFISFSSYMEGGSDLAIKTAMKLAYKGSLIMTSNPTYGQYFTAEPLHAFVRFGKWKDILSLPHPDENLIYAQLISSFARGLAQVRTRKLASATIESLRLDSIARLDTLNSIYFSFNPVSEIAKVPLNLLKGELLISQNKVDEGIWALQMAVDAEDNLRYMEPPDWKIPSRQFLGAALLEAGKYAEAEKVYLEDLKKNQGNGWSIKGLQLCQEKLGKKAEAAATAKRFVSAWKNADVEIKSSRF